MENEGVAGRRRMREWRIPHVANFAGRVGLKDVFQSYQKINAAFCSLSHHCSALLKYFAA
jgi:hypothetical protein